MGDVNDYPVVSHGYEEEDAVRRATIHLTLTGASGSGWLPVPPLINIITQYDQTLRAFTSTFAGPLPGDDNKLSGYLRGISSMTLRNYPCPSRRIQFSGHFTHMMTRQEHDESGKPFTVVMIIELGNDRVLQLSKGLVSWVCNIRNDYVSALIVDSRRSDRMYIVYSQAIGRMDRDKSGTWTVSPFTGRHDQYGTTNGSPSETLFYNLTAAMKSHDGMDLLVSDFGSNQIRSVGIDETNELAYGVTKTIQDVPNPLTLTYLRADEKSPIVCGTYHGSIYVTHNYSDRKTIKTTIVDVPIIGNNSLLICGRLADNILLGRRRGMVIVAIQFSGDDSSVVQEVELCGTQVGYVNGSLAVSAFRSTTKGICVDETTTPPSVLLHDDDNSAIRRMTLPHASTLFE